MVSNHEMNTFGPKKSFLREHAGILVTGGHFSDKRVLLASGHSVTSGDFGAGFWTSGHLVTSGHFSDTHYCFIFLKTDQKDTGRKLGLPCLEALTSA